MFIIRWTARLLICSMFNTMDCISFTPFSAFILDASLYIYIFCLLLLSLVHSGTRLYTMSTDHGNNIQTSSTHLPCYWLQIMMTELSHYTRWSFWRLVSHLNGSHETTESFYCCAVSFVNYICVFFFFFFFIQHHFVAINMSYSYFQTLQHVLITSLEKSPQTNPIIGRIECKAGHGAGRPTQKMVNIFCLD